MKIIESAIVRFIMFAIYLSTLYIEKFVASQKFRDVYAKLTLVQAEIWRV